MKRFTPDRWTDEIPWTGQYVLDEQGNAVPATGLLTWAKWMADHAEDSHLDDQIGEARVSTIFIGLDSGAMFMMDEFDPVLYRPKVWETMVFGGPYSEYQLRYTSRQAAQEGHRKIVQMLTS